MTSRVSFKDYDNHHSALTLGRSDPLVFYAGVEDGSRESRGGNCLGTFSTQYNLSHPKWVLLLTLRSKSGGKYLRLIVGVSKVGLHWYHKSSVPLSQSVRTRSRYEISSFANISYYALWLPPPAFEYAYLLV